MSSNPAMPNALKLFICYSRRDTATADALVKDLESAGFEVTIDRRDLPYGEKWQAEISDFIRLSDTVVWLISPSSISSDWCNWELGEVQRRRKRLIPIKIACLRRVPAEKRSPVDGISLPVWICTGAARDWRRIRCNCIGVAGASSIPVSVQPTVYAGSVKGAHGSALRATRTGGAARS